MSFSGAVTHSRISSHHSTSSHVGANLLVRPVTASHHARRLRDAASSAVKCILQQLETEVRLVSSNADDGTHIKTARGSCHHVSTRSMQSYPTLTRLPPSCRHQSNQDQDGFSRGQDSSHACVSFRRLSKLIAKARSIRFFQTAPPLLQ